LHKSEGEKSEPNELMSFKKTSHDPLANSVTNGFDEFFDSSFIVYGNLKYSFKEEFNE